MTTTRQFLLLLTTATLTPLTRSAEPDPAKLLAEVSDRHREALEGIRTVSFAFEWTTLKSEPLHYTAQTNRIATGSDVVYETGPGRYRQTPERCRLSSHWSDGSSHDSVQRHECLLSFHSPVKDRPIRSTGLTTQVVGESAHLRSGQYLSLLFHHTGCIPGVHLPFHQLLEQPHTLTAVERTPSPDDGRPSEIRVELKTRGGRYEFWFSPTHNHLIRKRVWHPFDEAKHRHEAEVTAFAEPNPGQFFPAVIEFRASDSGELRQHNRRVVSEVQVNRPIPADHFRIPNIAGQVCKDHTLNRSYQVDADGYRVGEFLAEEEERFRLQKAAAEKSPTPIPDPDGSLPWWAWAVFGSLTLCLTAAVMEIYRLRTSARPGTPSV